MSTASFDRNINQTRAWEAQMVNCCGAPLWLTLKEKCPRDTVEYNSGHRWSTGKCSSRGS